MPKKTVRSNDELIEIYERHKTMLYHICFSYLKNSADAEDAVSNTFFQLVKLGTVFESQEHEKAWLIRTASNLCKNSLRHWWRKRTKLTDLDQIPCDGATAEVPIDDALYAVMELPDKYKTVVYLYYYEGYNGVEIATMLHKPPSTIRNHLHEARKLLRERLGDLLHE